MLDRTLTEIFDKFLGTEMVDSVTYFIDLHHKNYTIEDIKKLHPELTYEQIMMLKLTIAVTEIKSVLKRMSSKLNLNIRGKFVVADENGDMIRYSRGDVVRYENQDYVATKHIKNARKMV